MLFQFIIFASVKHLLHRIFLIPGIVTLLCACENDIERINMLTEESSVPSVQGKNIKVIYSDSAVVKVRITAPSFVQHTDAERPYMEFPEGMNVHFFNDSLEVESDIRANYAIYYSEERLWHATGNVVAKGEGGDALYTEELFWDEGTAQIYSDAYTRIQNEDGIFHGKKGFISNQDLSNWQLKGTSGTVNVQDEE